MQNTNQANLSRRSFSRNAPARQNQRGRQFYSPHRLQQQGHYHSQLHLYNAQHTSGHHGNGHAYTQRINLTTNVTNNQWYGQNNNSNNTNNNCNNNGTNINHGGIWNNTSMAGTVKNCYFQFFQYVCICIIAVFLLTLTYKRQRAGVKSHVIQILRCIFLDVNVNAIIGSIYFIALMYVYYLPWLPTNTNFDLK